VGRSVTRVLVLGGGPDAEREVSIQSARGVHAACGQAGLDAELLIIDTPKIDEVRAWDADVIFPVVHGRFGEGGRLQSMLEDAGIAFIGSGSRASRRAMDKMGTKLAAARLGIPTPDATILDPDDERPPIHPPLVIKPVADGSSYGLHLCRDDKEWRQAIREVRGAHAEHPDRVSMVEPLVQGRELTVGVLDNGSGTLDALPIVEIAPASGVYDHRAKYERSDTVYTVSPDLADGLAGDLERGSLGVCGAIGVRHLARVDFLLDAQGVAHMLEVNTMPGFTRASLFPKAALAHGLGMPGLCAQLVRCALRR